MAQDYIYLTGLFLSSVILVAAFTIKTLSKKPGIVLLLTGDSGLVASHLLYSYASQTNQAAAIIIFIVINTSILWKLFCNETAVQQKSLSWKEIILYQRAGIIFRDITNENINQKTKIKSNKPETNRLNPASVLVLTGIMILVLAAVFLIN